MTTDTTVPSTIPSTIPITKPNIIQGSVNIQKLIHNSRLKAKAITAGLDAFHYIRLEAEAEAKLSGSNLPVATAKASPMVQLTLPILGAENPVTKLIPATLASPAAILNEAQLRAVALAVSGQSFVLAGSAGTGKTFTVSAILDALTKDNKIPFMTEATKVLAKGDYGFIACAYTRRATNVVRRNLPRGLKAGTIHSVLEFKPEFYTEIDPETKNLVKRMRFVETRTADNPLPPCVTRIVIDEASMVSVELFNKLLLACPHKPQFIFIGDLAQLKPVFGDAILGYKLSELPVVELTQVYRQKDGEILDFVTDVRNGIQVKDFSLPQYKNERLMIKQFKKPDTVGVRTAQIGHTLQQAIKAGELDPLSGDLILVPFNVGVGTIELNKHVADYYDQTQNRSLVPIVAGFKTAYYAIGDKLLIDRNDAVIIDIQPNPKYIGRQANPPSNKLSRWGSIRGDKHGISDEANEEKINSATDEDADFEAMLHSIGSAELSLSDIDTESRTTEASHIISYYFIDPSQEQIDDVSNSLDKSNILSMSSAGDINKLELAYCISIHKSQGSQAKRVWVILVKQHATMLSRELLYTAATRAAESLTIIADVGTINKCINNARIKGDSLAEKAEFFKGRIKEVQ